MKTKVEIEGYEIEIELDNGVISVKAEKDDEVVEEFTINIEESQDGEESQDSEDVQGFDEFAQEEDFEGEEFEGEEDMQDMQDEEDDDDMQDEEDDDEDIPKALESFQSFINKRK